MEIISYYENAPAAPDAFVDATPYYTFNYVYNPNEGDTSLDNLLFELFVAKLICNG
ncbi:hypothetical protein Q2T40_05290 [Winogradskyella maritima]|nr:hypothetical protein [Winogradskyella maritima]